jgi:hypothetical protein
MPCVPPISFRYIGIQPLNEEPDFPTRSRSTLNYLLLPVACEILYRVYLFAFVDRRTNTLDRVRNQDTRDRLHQYGALACCITTSLGNLSAKYS